MRARFVQYNPVLSRLNLTGTTSQGYVINRQKPLMLHRGGRRMKAGAHHCRQAPCVIRMSARQPHDTCSSIACIWYLLHVRTISTWKNNLAFLPWPGRCLHLPLQVSIESSSSRIPPFFPSWYLRLSRARGGRALIFTNCG